MPRHALRTLKGWPLWGLLLTVGACAGDADQSGTSGEFDDGPGSGFPSGPPTDPGGGADVGTSGSGGSAGALPPETEVQVDFEVPRAGAQYVFVANPRRDTVAVIDSSNLAIRTVEVGDKPAALVTVNQKDVALALNAGSADLSVLRATPTAVSVSTLPVGAGVNRISVSPSGSHALAWYDSRIDGGLGGAGSFQDVSLIRLSPQGDVAIPLTVGFRPSAVSFSTDDTSAFVVTDDGVSIVRFAQITAPAVVPLVPLQAAAQMGAADVSITPDGKFALGRKEGSAEVSLVDLQTGIATKLTLGAAVTDLDLAPDGTFAVAVLREAKQMLTLPLPLGFSDANARVVQTFPDDVVGSATLTPDGKMAFLYTTVGDAERALLVAVDGTAAPRAVVLRKGVRGVAIAPSGGAAVVLHTKQAGDPEAPGLDVESKIDRAFGYSVVALASGFAKLQLTAAEPGPLAIVPDSSRAFVLLRDDARDLRVAQQIDLQSFLVKDFVLGSPPLAIATLVGSNRVFVSQMHPAGRLSFIDWVSGEVQSVTGFELNGGIRQ